MGVTGIRERRRVRVWFGDYVMVDRTLDSAHAERFAVGMQRRFVSLRVSIDPVLAKASTGLWQSGPC